MSTLQKVSLVFGALFALVGVAGFVTTGTTMEARIEHAPRLFGLFPVNLLHNLVHLGFGLWGLLGSRSPAGALGFCRGAGLIYLVLTVLAFVTPTTFGLIPIGGHDIWFHGLIGSVLTYFGFFRNRVVPPVEQVLS